VFFISYLMIFTSKPLAVKVDIAVGNVVIFAVLNVDCVDGTPFEI